MKMLILSLALLLTVAAPNAWAVTDAQDIATTIKLRGYTCGGNTVSNIHESTDASGTRTIVATCPNGKRYRIVVSPQGHVSVQPAR
jgi:hypothetical protein